MEQIGKNTEQRKDGKRGKNPNSLANLEAHKWKKGQSGNPRGHPLGMPNYNTARERAIRLLAKQNKKSPQEIEDEINANALLEARKGNFSFYKDDKDRVYGTAIQKQELIGELKIGRLEEIQKATEDILK